MVADSGQTAPSRHRPPSMRFGAEHAFDHPAKRGAVWGSWWIYTRWSVAASPCLEPVVGFADDRQAVVLQQAAQRGARGGGVVGEKHAGVGWSRILGWVAAPLEVSAGMIVDWLR